MSTPITRNRRYTFHDGTGRMIRDVQDPLLQQRQETEWRDPRTARSGTAPAYGGGRPTTTPGAQPVSETGSVAPAGMHRELLGSFPAGDSRYCYWLAQTPDGVQVWRRDVQTQTPAEQVGEFPLDRANSYVHTAESADAYSVYRVDRTRLDPGNTTVPNVASLRPDAMGAKARSQTSDLSRIIRRGPYLSGTRDSPGTRFGSRAAAVIRRSVDAIAAINKANRDKWS
jgi:hypothetical protein